MLESASRLSGFPASVAGTLGFWDAGILRRFGFLRTWWWTPEIGYPLWWFPKTTFLAHESHAGPSLGMLQSCVRFWWRWRRIRRFWHSHLSYRIRSLRCLSTSWCVNFLTFLRISSRGRSSATISRVDVLFPKRLPLLSVAEVMKLFGHLIWKPRIVSFSTFVPITPQPMFPDHFEFSEKPAASVVNEMVASGGSSLGGQIGSHLVGWVRKFPHTWISWRDLASSVVGWFFVSFARIWLRLNLNMFMNGHIVEM